MQTYQRKVPSPVPPLISVIRKILNKEKKINKIHRSKVIAEELNQGIETLKA